MRRMLLLGLVLLPAVAVPVVSRSFYREGGPAAETAARAQAWVGLLDEEQKQAALLPYDTPQRVDWHFIPKPERKGLQIKHMTSGQRQAANQLLRSALSEAGYDKARQIMALESLLLELEGPRDTIVRDSERYYVTLFGEPSEDGRWGLSVEGHHLSLNFAFANGEVTASSPQMFGSNPAVVKNENQTGIAVGTRVLAKEETLAFDLVNSLTDDQKPTAIIDDTAPREVRAAGEAQPPREPAVGIPFSQLTQEQRDLLRELVMEYVNAVPPAVAAQRQQSIRDGGVEEVRFAWAGPTEPGIGHYYRVQGPQFLIEFVNTQPDAAGNPANHIHAVWRDLRGDFAIPITQ